MVIFLFSQKYLGIAIYFPPHRLRYSWPTGSNEILAEGNALYYTESDFR